MSLIQSLGVVVLLTALNGLHASEVSAAEKPSPSSYACKDEKLGRDYKLGVAKINAKCGVAQAFLSVKSYFSVMSSLLGKTNASLLTRNSNLVDDKGKPNEMAKRACNALEGQVRKLVNSYDALQPHQYVADFSQPLNHCPKTKLPSNSGVVLEGEGVMKFSELTTALKKVYPSLRENIVNCVDALRYAMKDNEAKYQQYCFKNPASKPSYFKCDSEAHARIQEGYSDIQKNFMRTLFFDDGLDHLVKDLDTLDEKSHSCAGDKIAVAKVRLHGSSQKLAQDNEYGAPGRKVKPVRGDPALAKPKSGAPGGAATTEEE